MGTWEPAFRDTGFRDVLEVRAAPSPTDGPDFDLRDLGRSILWNRGSDGAWGSGTRVRQ